MNQLAVANAISFQKRLLPNTADFATIIPARIKRIENVSLHEVFNGLVGLVH
jgi:hypothetical protein